MLNYSSATIAEPTLKWQSVTPVAGDGGIATVADICHVCLLEPYLSPTIHDCHTTNFKSSVMGNKFVRTFGNDIIRTYIA